MGYFHQSQAAIDQFKNNLIQRGIRLVTEETEFKVTVQAQVNQSVRLLEASGHASGSWRRVGEQRRWRGPGGTLGNNGKGAPAPDCGSG